MATVLGIIILPEFLTERGLRAKEQNVMCFQTSASLILLTFTKYLLKSPVLV